MRITGTFIDEITHDIPSQNWGPIEWRREFELFQKIGIDTAIIIRAGYGNKCIFPAKCIPDLLPIDQDLGRLFFALAEEFGVRIFFGLYDSGYHWLRRTWWKEVEVNNNFIDEAAERYGGSPAFAGWYLCHETSKNDVHIIELYNHLGRKCKESIDLPVLISPFPQGAKQFSEGAVMGLDESLDHWSRIFEATKGAFDICAFQDGQIHYQQLPAFHRGIAELGKAHDITIWSNVETFDRDMPIIFPPADWRYLRIKLEAAAAVADKIVSFELPHFMSPNSSYHSARNLFSRYCEHFGILLS